MLTKAIIDLATEYGRYGYRRVTALLHRQGWQVNHKRVERIWRREGLKVPQKQPKRARLWLNDGSCIRLRATHPNHVWSYDFVMDRTHNGKAYRMLTVIDEYTHECLAIKTKRQLNSTDVLECLNDLFTERGVPEHIRSDNGAEFTAIAVREWLSAASVRTLFIGPDRSPAPQTVITSPIAPRFVMPTGGFKSFITLIVGNIFALCSNFRVFTQSVAFVRIENPVQI